MGDALLQSNGSKELSGIGERKGPFLTEMKLTREMTF